jgi:hypothetical protein
MTFEPNTEADALEVDGTQGGGLGVPVDYHWGAVALGCQGRSGLVVTPGEFV